MRILVTGKNGGLAKELRKVIPNAIYNSQDYCNLESTSDTRYMVSQCKPDIVVHVAAKVGGLMDNFNHQYDYMHKNVIINDNIINACLLYNVPKIIAISSSCAYPDSLPDSSYPLQETSLHDGAPTISNLSYGYSKRLMQVQIDACNSQYKTNHNYIIASNLYGPTDNFTESGHFMSKLIKELWLFKTGKKDKIVMKGSGDAYRQYTHYNDLARCIKWHIDNKINESYNFSYPVNLKTRVIAEIATKALDVFGNSVEFLCETPTGQLRKDVSIDRFLRLNKDFPFTSVYDGVRSTYKTMERVWGDKANV